ncbi:hypothetical protein LRP49_08685 [Enterovibrio sp. ZSDZ35]|uniref:Porin n=1 Tax=Enterovibrio qingdaonensis TaxID=2899818 RepID=A0ABT5QJW2_9GAMM|nr:hypothetical protein [Enterovibrio sp. ZSDZ35]MDD1781282.1 hypothetical protein [Enterovibrio sp. ZSDZ35]
MKTHTLLFALAGICAPFSASSAVTDINQDVSIDWGMDAYLQAFSVTPDAGENQHGYTSRFKMTANLLLDDGWSINTRWQAYYDWSGDRRHSGGSGTNFTDGENADGLSLDLGYLQYAANDWIFRAGRQRADWGYGFNIENDRRDRLLAMKSLSYGQSNSVSVLGIYDLRFAEKELDTTYDVYDDVHMYALAAVGKHGIVDWGMLWAYFDGGANNIGDPSQGIPQQGYGIDYFHNVSPFLTVNLDALQLRSGVNIILSDSNETRGKYTTWGDDSLAGFIEASYSITPNVTVQAQGIGYVDGGLVGRGFDTYSGLINNSDRNDPSPIARQYFGGLGHEGNDGQIYAARLDWQMDDALNIKVAAGHMSISNHLGNGQDTEAQFVDAKALYAWSKHTNIGMQVSWANEDIDDLAVMARINIRYH